MTDRQDPEGWVPDPESDDEIDLEADDTGSVETPTAR